MDVPPAVPPAKIPSQNPSKPFPIVPILLSLLILLFGSSTAYLAYQNVQLQKQVKDLSSPQLTIPTPAPTNQLLPTPTCRPRPDCLDQTPRCLIPETSDMCPPAPKTTGQQAMGIQTSVCCSCPTMVNQSLIGTNGWVLYEKGKDYSSQITANCTNILCSPCPPLPSPTGVTYTCPPGGYVDCMPILTPEKQAACSAEAMTWYKANCPDFKGGAL